MDNCLNFPCIPLEPLVKCTEIDRERHQTPLDQSTSQTWMGGGNTGDFSSVWMSYNRNLGFYLQSQKFFSLVLQFCFVIKIKDSSLFT